MTTKTDLLGRPLSKDDQELTKAYAQAAAIALLANTELSPREIVDRALAIAADICIYTNQQRTIEVLE